VWSSLIVVNIFLSFLGFYLKEAGLIFLAAANIFCFIVSDEIAKRNEENE
jgi:hypothetical protein